MDPSPNMVPAHSLIGGAENMKLLFDTTMALMQQGIADNQRNAREYAALNLRHANNGLTVDHLANLAAIISGQSGDTAAQQTTSPIRTGTGDAVAAAAYPANRTVDESAAAVAAGVAESVQGNVTQQLAILSQTVSSLGGTITTALQAVADSNAAIASALSALKGAATPAPSPAVS